MFNKFPLSLAFISCAFLFLTMLSAIPMFQSALNYSTPFISDFGYCSDLPACASQMGMGKFSSSRGESKPYSQRNLILPLGTCLAWDTCGNRRLLMVFCVGKSSLFPALGPTAEGGGAAGVAWDSGGCPCPWQDGGME